VNVVDLFAGGGGASHGIRMALGVEPIVAVNHDPAAIAMHAANHPHTLHLCESVFDVDPLQATNGRRVDLLWASPDCKHFSKAKGGKPRDNNIRGLAWVVITWARAVRPSVICVENVEEFVEWGPLDPETHQPIPERKGETFRRWAGRLRGLGYSVDWRILNAADYGAPTSRKRLFLVARRDNLPIRWPEPTHGPARPQPYRTAAECIDWSIPTPSIFGRKKPLADKTLARIAEGIRRYVINAGQPYVVDRSTGERVAPYLVETRNGEREGQAPRTRDIHRPFGTVTAQGSQGALCAAFLAKNYTGVFGSSLDRPVGTITARDHHGLVAALLTKYYGTGVGQSLDEPMHTVVTKARFGLVAVEIAGEPYTICDIGYRMLAPRELARAQGFPEDYVLTGTQTEQIARIGNSVSPHPAAAVVAANFAPTGVGDPLAWAAK
jgi:DNA (cytosine-5)-methyltransferase 1